ncbi:MAG: gluconate 2-dehydrogenase subunit 3 family protein, partial [Caldimonas sp.]
NEPTRRVIDARLATPRAPRFFTEAEWAVADALTRRVLPVDDDAVPLVVLLDAKLLADHGDGFRDADMPYMREAWQRGLAALDADAKSRHEGRGFATLSGAEQDAMLERMQAGEATAEHWSGMDPRKFFTRRVLVDVPALFYCQPAAWNEMGFGGPASPRGYVRLEGDRHDPWEAAEAAPGSEASAERQNRRVV